MRLPDPVAARARSTARSTRPAAAPQSRRASARFGFGSIAFLRAASAGVVGKWAGKIAWALGHPAAPALRRRPDAPDEALRDVSCLARRTCARARGVARRCRGLPWAPRDAPRLHERNEHDPGRDDADRRGGRLFPPPERLHLLPPPAGVQLSHHPTPPPGP